MSGNCSFARMSEATLNTWRQLEEMATYVSGSFTLQRMFSSEFYRFCSNDKSDDIQLSLSIHSQYVECGVLAVRQLTKRLGSPR